MSNNRLLKRHISNLINNITLTDDHIIEGVCQLLNVKYPLEEPKEQPKTIYMLFGKTEQEILRALEFYDKHSEQAVQNDLTRSEAITLVRELTHSSWTERAIIDFIDCLSGLNVLKLKKNTERDNIIIEAQKFSAEYVEYDFKNPVNTISQMSRIIGKLLHIIKGDDK